MLNGWLQLPLNPPVALAIEVSQSRARRELGGARRWSERVAHRCTTAAGKSERGVVAVLRRLLAYDARKREGKRRGPLRPRHSRLVSCAACVLRRRRQPEAGVWSETSAAYAQCERCDGGVGYCDGEVSDAGERHERHGETPRARRGQSPSVGREVACAASAVPPLD
eukprot:scaffold201170_cov33-Tisochrysis_lutea.AAC.9